MKKLTILFVAILTIASYSLTAQVAITTDGSQPAGSAMLDVKSTNKGFLPPRMTTTDRDLINSPAEGLIIYNQTTECIEFYKSSTWVSLCGDSGTPVSDVTNPTTGKTWLDRNLGASQVATSSIDADSYGYLYQWGRLADGHQLRTSSTTTLMSQADTPGHGDFITPSGDPGDWRTPKNNNLWQGVDGINNPCPNGYRLPTEVEWEAERLSWSSNDAAGAFASPLKLPVAGNRRYSNGDPTSVGSVGFYWSSTVDDASSRHLEFYNILAYMASNARAYGCSVRCIKD